MSQAPTIDADLLSIARADPRARGAATGIDEDLLSLARATPQERSAGAILRSVSGAPAPLRTPGYTVADRLAGRAAPPGSPLANVPIPERRAYIDENTYTTDPAVIAFRDQFEQTRNAVTDEEVASFQQLFPTMAGRNRFDVASAIAERKLAGPQGFMHSPEGPSGWAGYKRNVANELARFAPPIGGRLGEWKQAQMQYEPAAPGVAGTLGSATASALESLPAILTGGAGAIPAMAPLVAGVTNQKLESNLDQGVSEPRAVVNALGTGVIELATEYIPLGKMRELGDEGLSALGRMVAKRDWTGVGTFLQRMAGVGNVEGMEELASTLGEGVLDVATGVKSFDQARQDVQSQLIPSYTQGFLAGALMEGPAYVGGKALQGYAERQSQKPRPPSRRQVAEDLARQYRLDGLTARAEQGTLFHIEQEMGPEVRRMEADEAYDQRAAEQRGEKARQEEIAYGERRKQNQRQYEREAWARRQQYAEASRQAAEGLGPPELEAWRQSGLRDHQRGEKPIRHILDEASRAFYDAGFKGITGTEGAPAAPTAPALTFRSVREAYEAGYALGQSGEAIEQTPGEREHASAYQRGYTRAIEEQYGLARPEASRSVNKREGASRVQLPSGVAVPDPTSLGDLLGQSLQPVEPMPSTLAGQLAAKAGTLSGRPVPRGTAQAGPAATATRKAPEGPAAPPAARQGYETDPDEVDAASEDILGHADALRDINSTLARPNLQVTAKDKKDLDTAQRQLQEAIEAKLQEAESRFGPEVAAKLREKAAATSAAEDDDQRKARMLREYDESIPEDYKPGQPYATHEADEPGGGYEPGHPWYYHTGGAILTPEEVVARGREKGKTLDVDKIGAKPYPKGPKRLEALRSALASMSAQLAEDLATYTDLATNGPRAKSIEDYSRTFGQHGPADALKTFGSSIGAKFNHLSYAAARVQALEDAIAKLEADEAAPEKKPKKGPATTGKAAKEERPRPKPGTLEFFLEHDAQLDRLKSVEKWLGQIESGKARDVERTRKGALFHLDIVDTALADGVERFGAEAMAEHTQRAADVRSRLMSAQGPGNAPEPEEEAPEPPKYDAKPGMLVMVDRGQGASVEAEVLSVADDGYTLRVKETASGKRYPVHINNTEVPPAPKGAGDRRQLIERIVQAAERTYPVHTIEERFELQGDNGKWYRPNGFPLGVKSTGERRSIGFGLTNKDGVYVGQLTPTREEQEQRLAAIAKERQDDFRKSLEGMDEAQLASQAAYWLKDGAPLGGTVDHGERPGIDEPNEDEPSDEQADDEAPEPEAAKGYGEKVSALATALGGLFREAKSSGEPVSKEAMFREADRAFGGTQAEGAWSPTDLWDAIEFTMNRAIAKFDPHFLDNENILASIAALRKELNNVPTRTRRTEEQEEFQQFSTPVDYAAAVAWVANIGNGDRVMEPSAGTGTLAAWAMSRDPIAVYVNELSKRRLAILEQLKARSGTSVRRFNENAEQIDNVLPPDVKPTVVLMNPPFSASAGRLGPGTRDTTVGAQHIEAALERLEEGGRLVAIVGRGMEPDAARFKKWWGDISSKFTVRANVGVSGKVYAKNGTSFATRVLVIDKTGPSNAAPVTGDAESVKDLVPLLQEVRDARRAKTRDDDGDAGADTDGEGVQGPSGGVGQGGGTGLSTKPPTGPRGPGGGGTSTSGNGGGPATGDRDGPRMGPGRTGGARGGRSGGSNRGGGKPETGGRNTDRGAGADTRRPDTRVQAEPAELTYTALAKPPKSETVGIYNSYTPQRLKIAGAQPHPSPLVESAAMAAVVAPMPTYKPMLSPALVTSGALSEPQLEAVVYAGQAHSDTLVDGSRKGFFIGDGTGVGKGREISAVMLDNINRGRKKHVWITENTKLLKDAQRDFSALGGDPELIKNLGAFKFGKKIENLDEGIMLVGYGTLAKKSPKDKDGKRAEASRLNQLIEWLGPDFDGVIAFDEAHNLGNSLDMGQGIRKKEASQRALAGIELQAKLPKARVLYVSATGATDVSNYAYLDRLGLWGEGTSFPRKQTFIADIATGGVAAMELVARDMKQMGLYLARSISFRDPENRPNMSVEQQALDINLSPDQLAIYDELARAWQSTLKGFEGALKATKGNKSGMAKMNANSRYWSTHQRFFSHVITAFKMPEVLDAVEADLAAGFSPVLQLTNTREADLDRALAGMEEGQELEDLDLTPRDQLINLVQEHFPIAQYEEYEDENGNKRVRVARDSEGNVVINKKAVAMRDQLVQNLKDIRVPEGPIDMLLNRFGPDKVAEASGRTHRVYRVRQPDGSLKMIEESWSPVKTKADQQAFMDGKKHVLVFSQAGGTGASYHAERNAKNQRRRIHYLVQPGWQADKAIQGLGRTHRSNQSSAPVYKLVTTNLKGEKRFVATIARRLDQLGALTKGQRQTGSQGMFKESDNLESFYAEIALERLWKLLQQDALTDFPRKKFEELSGLKVIKDDGNPENTPAIKKFLNRLLSFNVADQNNLFDKFESLHRAVIDNAIAQGVYETGIEQLDADAVEKIGDRVAWTDPRTGSETRLVQLRLKKRNRPEKFKDIVRDQGDFYVNKTSGRVWFVSTRTTSHTGRSGDVTLMRWVRGPVSGRHAPAKDFENKDKWIEVSQREAAPLWEEHVKLVPEFRTSKETMLVGMLLPIWDRLPKTTTRVATTTTEDGERLLGRTLRDEQLPDVLKALGLGAEVPAWAKDGKQALTRLQQGASVGFANGWQLKKATVEREKRIELVGPDSRHNAELARLGLFSETISWRTRFFLPTSAEGADVYEKLIAQRPLVEANEAGVRSKEDLDAAKARQRARLEDMDKDALQELARQMGLSDRGDKGALIDQISELMPADDVGDLIDPTDPFETMGAMANPRHVVTRSGQVKYRPPTAAELGAKDGGGQKAHFPFEHGDEKRYQAAHGIGQATLLERLRAFWQAAREDLAKWTQRGSIPDLPRAETWGEARAVLLQIRKARNVAQFQAAKLFKQVEARLAGPIDVELFERSVLLDDLAETDGPLPFGFTAETVKLDKAKIDAAVARNPAVQAAKEFRAQMWESLKGDYSRAGKAVGWDVGKRLTRKSWYRHQVLHYFRLRQRLGSDAYAQGFPKPPAGAAIRTGRGFLKHREGSTLDINTHYLQAEWEALTAMREDTLRMRLQARLWKKHDILRSLKDAARADNNARAFAQMLADQGGDEAKARTEFNKRFKAPIAMAMDAINDVVGEDEIAEHSTSGPQIARVYQWASWASKNLPEGDRRRNVALMLLGATARVKADMERYLGRLTTWEDLVPEDHVAVHPRPGRTVFWAWSIPEQLAYKLTEAAAHEGELMGVSPEDLRRVQAMGSDFTPVVVPKRLAAALNNLHPMQPADLVDRAVRAITSAWKRLKLFAPWNWPRYRLRNQTEIDKMLMVSPTAAKKLPQAMSDLRKLFSWSDSTPPEAREWLERGGAHSMIRVVELGDVDAIEVLDKLVAPKAGGPLRFPIELAKRFQRGIHTANDYLESLYRYALYLDYLEQMQASGGQPRNFGVSVPAEVKGITDVRDRAYKLSNDAMGAYDDVSKVGDYLRRHWLPFWSFPELNMRAYTGFMRNLWRDPRVAGKTGAALFPAVARSSPFLAMRLGRAMIVMAGVQALLRGVNWLWGSDDDDEELPKDVQRRPHITFPRWLTRPIFGDDAVYHFDRLGTAGDFLEWFGADALPYDVSDIVTGHRTPKEVAEDYAKSAPNKLVNLLGPHVKTPIESISGNSLFPDAFKPRGIRDRWEYLADAVDAGAAYRKLAGKPEKPAAAFWSAPLVYRTEADASAYWYIQDEKRRYLKRQGRGDYGGSMGGRSDALAYFKQAMRFGDEEAAKRYLADYFSLGGTRRGLKESLERLDPLGGLNKDDRRRFVAGLREEDLDDLARAQRYYADVLLGEPGQTERLMREAVNATKKE